MTNSRNYALEELLETQNPTKIDLTKTVDLPPPPPVVVLPHKCPKCETFRYKEKEDILTHFESQHEGFGFSLMEEGQNIFSVPYTIKDLELTCNTNTDFRQMILRKDMSETNSIFYKFTGKVKDGNFYFQFKYLTSKILSNSKVTITIVMPKKQRTYIRGFTWTGNIYPHDCGDIEKAPIFILPLNQLKDLGDNVDITIKF